MSATFAITWVDEKLGFKDERRFTVSDEDGQRISWCYDRCYGCEGDTKAIFEAILAKMMGALIDVVHQYELSHVKDPIIPQPE